MARFRGVRQRKLNVGIEGADEVIKLLEEMGAAASDILEQAAEAGGLIVLENAKNDCPKDTGALKDSLHIEKGKSRILGRRFEYCQANRNTTVRL